MKVQNAGVIDAVLELAATEAATAGFSEITPAHLLMALSKLCEVPTDFGAPDAIAAIRREFEQLGIDPRVFRRGLRTALGKGGARPPGGVLHRSSACKKLFVVAENLAAQDSVPFGPAHLARAAFLGLGHTEDSSAVTGSLKGAADTLPTEL